GKVIIDEYVEPGVSALPLDKRPRFRDMIDRIIRQRDAKTVIVYMLNRFARNRYEDAIVGLTLEKLGVTVISAKEPVNGDDPATRMMRGMIAVYNQYQSEASSADIKEKLAHKARRGGTIGYTPVGYLNVKEEFDGRKVNTVAVDPERSPYIRHMFELYATGRYSFADIREILTEQGLRTRPTKKRPAGTAIASGTIGKILTDRYYLGYIKHNGIEHPGRHEALITEELFDKVQKVLAANGHSGTRRRIHQHHLKGLLRCGRCKKRFILANNTGNGGTYPYMFCMGRMKHLCDMPYLRLDGRGGIEAAVSAHYATVTLSEETRARLTAEVDQAIAAEQALSEHIRTQLGKTLAQLQDRENALFSLIGHPDWDQTKLNAQMQHVKRDSATTRKQLADMGQALDTGRAVFLQALDLLTDTRATYDREPNQVKTLLTKTIFGKLYLDADPDGGTVTVSDADLADPFAAILNTAHNPPQTATGPGEPNASHSDGLSARYALWQPQHNTEGDSLPWETIALSDQKDNRAYGSNKPCLVGTTGFEPATPCPDFSWLSVGGAWGRRNGSYRGSLCVWV
ncbi:MAG TPA: recombinase family protein, partial [Pseudonocardiaceae bacterium]|nr:recombinase family protein [Pseudonocardiaceae bacterium]